MSQRSASLPPKSEKVAPGSTGSTSRSFFFFTPPGVRAGGRSAATSHEADHLFQKTLKVKKRGLCFKVSRIIKSRIKLPKYEKDSRQNISKILQKNYEKKQASEFCGDEV
jgi:hypothetical protein